MPRNIDTTKMQEWHKLQYEIRLFNYAKSPTICGACKKELSYEKRTNKFCSRSCAAKYNGEMHPKKGLGKFGSKPCLNCGEITNFKCCSRQCTTELKRKQIIERWLKDEVISTAEKVPSAVRLYLIQEAGSKCSKCGWCEINPTTGKSPLAIDHIDGNSSNHSKYNLRVLCPNCHSLTSTYGALNKGKGRKKRYKTKIFENKSGVGLEDLGL